ncbi:MAG: DUF6452 family protein [Clostridium sp.]|nr:DUF6452 family protein [Clostridium sp.]
MLLILPALFALLGCSSNECLENGTSLPMAGFFSSEPAPQPVALEGLKVRAINAPGDSVLFDGTSQISELYLPFNLDADVTSYVFEYPSSSGFAADTISFHYLRQPWFVSSACGAVVNFKIEDISHSSFMIDSVACPDSIITNAVGQNIKIYFKVSDEQIPE